MTTPLSREQCERLDELLDRLYETKVALAAELDEHMPKYTEALAQLAIGRQAVAAATDDAAVAADEARIARDALTRCRERGNSSCTAERERAHERDAAAREARQDLQAARAALDEVERMLGDALAKVVAIRRDIQVNADAIRARETKALQGHCHRFQGQPPP